MFLFSSPYLFNVVEHTLSAKNSKLSVEALPSICLGEIRRQHMAVVGWKKDMKLFVVLDTAYLKNMEWLDRQTYDYWIQSAT